MKSTFRKAKANEKSEKPVLTGREGPKGDGDGQRGGVWTTHGPQILQIHRMEGSLCLKTNAALQGATIIKLILRGASFHREKLRGYETHACYG
jgi:hypothetical protein